MAQVHVVDLNAVEFLEGISDLKNSFQIAVYTVVCLAIYARQGPIANDAEWIHGMVKLRRTADTRRFIDQLVALRKLQLTADGKLTNGRCERALETARRRMGGLGSKSTRSRLEVDSKSSRSRLDLEPVSAKTNGLDGVHGATTTTTITKDSLTHTESVAARARNGSDGGGGGGDVSELELERFRRWRVPDELEARLLNQRRDITSDRMRARTREWRQYAIENGIPRNFEKSWFGFQLATQKRRRARSM